MSALPEGGILEGLRARAREHFGLDPQAPLPLVFVGSPGSRTPNTAVAWAAGARGLPPMTFLACAAGARLRGRPMQRIRLDPWPRRQCGSDRASWGRTSGNLLERKSSGMRRFHLLLFSFC